MLVIDFYYGICNAKNSMQHQLPDNFVSNKKEIELSLARTLLTQIEKKSFTFKKAQEIARFIVDKLDNLTTPKKLLDFLHGLSTRWVIFFTTYEFYKMRLAQEKGNKTVWQ